MVHVVLQRNTTHMAMKVFVLALSVASAYVPCSTRRAVVSCNLGNSGNSKNNNRSTTKNENESNHTQKTTT